MEIPCSEKSAQSKTSNFGLRFLRFFESRFKKRKKSRFFGFSKKRKKRILELWLAPTKEMLPPVLPRRAHVEGAMRSDCQTGDAEPPTTHC